ncbi:formate/nitrite transporter family protein [Radicibacter daui]|uniref:formate/nitrite transporter family protein n=1 Tax=Radicibacter daui TaxID=3064829 RepID=UPI004046DE64
MPQKGKDDARRPRSAPRGHDEGQEANHLSEKEKEEVDEHAKLRPVAVYEIVRQEGEGELARPTSSLVWSGLSAGLSIGFSVYTQATLREYLPDAGWRPLVECWGYAVGFLIVILARQQLFTEITLTAMLPFLAKPDKAGALGIARLWALVFGANLIGTALFGAGIAIDAMHTPDIRAAALEIAREAIDLPVSYMFLRAIAAGWLVATVVWLLPSAGGAGFAVIALLTYLIALFHLSHIVAGSVEAFSLIFTGALGPWQAITHFFLPVTAGNIIGGSALFALVSYAQIARELDEPAGDKKPK